MDGELLSADDAWTTLRRCGPSLPVNAFRRFRYGDGFSHSRALGLQITLAVVPFFIAMAGLASAIGQGAAAEVILTAVTSLTPGGREDVVDQAMSQGSDGSGRRASLVALTLGLGVSLLSLTTAMAQIERGANRIYGSDLDRPTLPRYLRALALALTVGLAIGLGFLLMAAGESLGDAAVEVYGWNDLAEDSWDAVRWPLGLALTVAAMTTLLRLSPNRRQPGMSWLACGAGLSVILWLFASGALALYIELSGSFSETYGALTGIMALLLWAYLSSVAILLGMAFTAQLEAVHAGAPEPREEPEAEPAPVTGAR